MKYKLLAFLRATGILKLVDHGNFWFIRLLRHRSNKQFEAANPNFPLPPQDITFDALNLVDWDSYLRVGKLHAGFIANIIKRNCDNPSLDVLEWGCGPGRLIRHMPHFLSDRDAKIVGSDYSERTIHWCTSNLPGIDFVTNDLMPPIPLEDSQFDAIYNFSVFTHLSKEVQIAWAAELYRVLKPGGIIICTTHGENHTHLLTKQSECEQFDAGEVVIQGQYREGKKWFLAIHPEQFVTGTLLKDFVDVSRVPVDPNIHMTQVVWIGRKPISPTNRKDSPI